MAGRRGQLPGGGKGATDVLMGMGVKRTADGGFYLTADAVKEMRKRRLREHARSRVPSTSRYLYREGGGAGVRKGQSQWDQVSLEVLREIRERSALNQALHSARRHQVRQMSRKWNGEKGSVGWRVCHKDYLEPDAVPPEGFDRIIKTFERQMVCPSRRYCKTLPMAMAQLEEDYLTINRPAIEPLYSDFDPNYLVGWRPVDGALLWPTLFFLQRWFRNNPSFNHGYGSTLTEDNVFDMIAESMQVDVRMAEFVLVREGVAEQTYGEGELIVHPDYTRTDVRYAGYPPSHVEESAEIILSFINAWVYNSTFFTRGMLAEIAFAVTGNIHDQDLTAFVNVLRQATQGVQNAHQPPVLVLPEDGAVEVMNLKAPNTEMGFEGWMSLLASLFCAVYRADVSIIGAKPWDGGKPAPLSEAGRGEEIALAREEGLVNDLGHLNAMLDDLAERCHPDLRVMQEFGDYDPKKDAEITEIRQRTTKTTNELRILAGDDPIGFWLSSEKRKELGDDHEDVIKHWASPWNIPLQPTATAMLQQQASAEMFADQQANGFGGPGGQPGPFGEPPGGQGGPGGPPGQGQPPGGGFPPGQGQPPGQGGPGGAQPPQPAQPMAKGRVLVRVYEHM